MSVRQHEIVPLPAEVAAQLKSSATITTLADAVEGLLTNALDAAAHNVEIQVDFKRGYCSVKDDGVGIPAAEFSADGCLAQIHCTSRLNSIHSYGRFGRFLASLSSLSLLSIVSRHTDSTRTSGLIVHLSRVVSRRSQALDAHGTHVVVHNLFGDIPVRYKQQASRCEDASEVDRQFVELKRRIVSYLLASAAPVHLRLHLRGSSTKYIHRRVSPAVSRFDVNIISSTLQQASLTSPDDIWETASAMTRGISARAAISLTPAPSKHCQFVSLGGQPIRQLGMGNILYDAINNAFDKSNFGVGTHADDKTEARQANFRGRLVKSVDRYPRFFIRLDCGSDVFQSALDAPAPIQEILGLLAAMVASFLHSYGFERTPHPQRPRQDLRFANTNSKPTLDRPSFETWRRIKGINQATANELLHDLPFAGKEPQDLFLDEDVRILLDDIEGFSPPAISQPVDSNEQHSLITGLESENQVTWSDSRTGNVVRLNTNNGSVIPDTKIRRRAFEQRSRTSRPASVKQITERLKSWPSHAFPAKPETPLPSLVIDVDQQPDGNPVSLTEHTVSAADLTDARMLRQVDEKFLLVMAKPKVLVLVDQHAADERIKVEDLFRQLCSSGPFSLAKPLRFDLPIHECSLLLNARDYFRSWNIIFDVSGKNDTGSKSGVTVTHLPPLVAERCRLEPKILIEMLRSEIHSDRRLQSSRPNSVKATVGWLDRIVHCPSGLLEMVNSRACRSAIMFNDILGAEECDTLLKELARCHLPFQCAHGRPSMTVLGSLDGINIGYADSTISNFGNGGEAKSFGQAFKDWID